MDLSGAIHDPNKARERSPGFGSSLGSEQGGMFVHYFMRLWLMAKPSLPTVTCLAIGSSWFPGSQAVIARHFAKAQDLRATGAPWHGLVQPHQQMEL